MENLEETEELLSFLQVLHLKTFLKIFLREEVFQDKILLRKDPEEMKQHKVPVLLLVIRV